MPERGIEIRRATAADLDVLVPLFDAYRRFYRLAGDAEGARRFLQERVEGNQSVVFLALDGAGAAGFTQLYPSFSSGAMAPILILNDLFVAPESRRRGAGSALIEAAARYGRQAGAARLTLSTEIGNSAAQALYKKSGWKRDTDFLVYHRVL